jgi:bifunctional lysine-specific demethylase and histidyl-hydroxylase MINA
VRHAALHPHTSRFQSSSTYSHRSGSPAVSREAPPRAPPGEMHPSAMNRNGKKTKRKKRGGEEAAADGASSSSSFDRRVFPILLATAARQSNSYTDTLAARLLRREHSRSRKPLSPLPDSLVALLPFVLSSRYARPRVPSRIFYTNALPALVFIAIVAYLFVLLQRHSSTHRGCNASCRCTSVAALSCEVLGAAALKSMEAGETLASDSGITNGLARALRSRSRRVVEAACNAVMDLSASSVGRERLSGSPVLLRIL